MEDKLILLVEDNPDDQVLTLRALKKNNIRNRVVIRQDGAQALDFLFCQGADAGRDSHDLPQVILLDLKLPKVDGLEVLRRIRADERTRLLPVVILTSSKEEQDMIQGLAPLPGRVDEYPQVPLGLLLSYVVGESLGAEGVFDEDIIVGYIGSDNAGHRASCCVLRAACYVPCRIYFPAAR